MNALAVVGLVGRIIAVFSLLMLVPLAFALAAHDPAERAFLIAAAITAITGLGLSLLTRRHRRELQPRDGFLLVTLTWTLLPAFGALPLLLVIPGLSFTDAYFEAMSGLTTTGATVLTGLQNAAGVDQRLALLHGAGRGHGHHRAGGGHPAAAGRGRRAVVQVGDRRPAEGPEADAAHRRDRARAVGGVFLRSQPPAA
jgi:hypothetical protein